MCAGNIPTGKQETIYLLRNQAAYRYVVGSGHSGVSLRLPAACRIVDIYQKPRIMNDRIVKMTSFLDVRIREAIQSLKTSALAHTHHVCACFYITVRISRNMLPQKKHDF